LQLSYETNYRGLCVQTRGVLKKELIGHLRAARYMCQPKGGTTVDILVAAALPRAARLAEIDRTSVARVKFLWSAISLPRTQVTLLP
jgi:hypothetical protein